jgi:hypothetical protein
VRVAVRRRRRRRRKAKRIGGGNTEFGETQEIGTAIKWALNRKAGRRKRTQGNHCWKGGSGVQNFVRAVLRRVELEGAGNEEEFGGFDGGEDNGGGVK